MTRDEGVAIIQQQLGFRSDLSTVIVTNMKLAQTQLEAGPTKPWFLIKERLTKRTTTDEQRVAVPEDMLYLVPQAAIQYVPDDDQDGAILTLVKGDMDNLLTQYVDPALATGELLTGTPEAYAQQGSYFWIFPVPDDQYLLRIGIFEPDDLLTSNVENGWLKWSPYTLLGKAGGLVASALRDKEAKAIFTAMEQEGRVALYNLDVAREEADRDHQVGGPHF